MTLRTGTLGDHRAKMTLTSCTFGDTRGMPYGYLYTRAGVTLRTSTLGDHRAKMTLTSCAFGDTRGMPLWLFVHKGRSDPQDIDPGGP